MKKDLQLPTFPFHNKSNFSLKIGLNKMMKKDIHSWFVS